MKRTILSLAFLALCGCRSTPGFHFGWDFSLPPTIANVQPLTPIPAAMTTAYMAETPAPVPMMTRQYSIQTAPVADAPQADARFRTRAELLPMPRASGPCGSPCMPPAQ